MIRTDLMHRRTLAAFAIALVMLFVGVIDALAQDYQSCQNTYNQAQYQEAADCFSAVAQNAAVDKEIRKEALQYLGRAHIALNHMEKARQAIKTLLELEPPLVELNPDVEPPPLMDLYYEVRNSIEVPKQDPGMHTIAVMDFRNYAIDEHERWDPMQWGFSSMMIHQLNGAIDLKVVDRENVQWILQELKMQQESGHVDPSTAVRMGKLMGAHAMVFGGIYTAGRRNMRLDARVVKVETGEVLLGESVEGRAKNFYELLENLSLKVARALNSQLTETEIGSRTETKSLDAMRAYSEGLKLLERDDYQAAYEKFLQAQEYDPTYTRAKTKAESLQPVLAAATEASPESDTGSSGR